MLAKVLIKRRFKKGTNKEVRALLNEFRAGAMNQPGYITGQTLLVDGGIYPVETNKGWKMAEVVDYLTDTNAVAYTTGFYVVMNKDVWNGLSPEVQKVMTADGGTFSAELPPSAVTERGLLYYIEATDNAGNVSRYPRGAPDSLISVRV